MAPSNSDDEDSRILPKDYQPGSRTVIIGRGKKCLHHEGNKRLRNIVKEELTTYQTSRSKSDKSIILLSVVRQIRKSNKDGVGFVKQDLCTGRWHELTEFASRVSVAQAFRDALSNHYKSSKHSKQQKRQLERLRQNWPAASKHGAASGAGMAMSVHDAVAMHRARLSSLSGAATFHGSPTRGHWAASHAATGTCGSPMGVQNALSHALDILQAGEHPAMQQQTMMQQHYGMMSHHQQSPTAWGSQMATGMPQCYGNGAAAMMGAYSYHQGAGYTQHQQQGLCHGSVTPPFSGKMQYAMEGQEPAVVAAAAAPETVGSPTPPEVVPPVACVTPPKTSNVKHVQEGTNLLCEPLPDDDDDCSCTSVASFFDEDNSENSGTTKETCDTSTADDASTSSSSEDEDEEEEEDDDDDEDDNDDDESSHDERMEDDVATFATEKPDLLDVFRSMPLPDLKAALA